MANLSSAGPANLQAGPSNASILSEVHDLENAIDPSDNHQVEHEIHDEYNRKIASSVPNDAYVLHDNDVYVPPGPLATELSIYKEQVDIYEQRAKFELTLREREMLEQMSILIRDRNKKEENLKKELHSLYDQDAVMAIGVQNPFYLRKAKKAQPALYDGDVLLKTHHVPVIVTSSEEDLELAETTRIKMNEKMNDSVCVEIRVKIIPPNYSKENFMATFTPQTQLTPEQVLQVLLV
ncbi:hypothetical protein Tco_0531555 [Tanacetum coccineum]